MSFSTYSESLIRYPELGFSLDTSLMDLSADWLSTMKPKIDEAHQAIADLEAGAIANPDEDRMVGHYWLRNPSLAPNDEIKSQITGPLTQIKDFGRRLHNGDLTSPSGAPFKNLLIIGIGGSALGPQLITEAIAQNSPLETFFFDNTDPAGIDQTLHQIHQSPGGLAQTLVVVISKSGGTPETRNGMVEAMHAWDKMGLNFGDYAVAVTGEGSKLYNSAKEHQFLEIFPMEDWVGGRTSVLSTVGLVPMIAQGVPIDEMIQGAAEMDELTRQPNDQNAALRLALAWYHSGDGKGKKDMVVLPYKDSLALFSKYLQQLVMESLGKEKDLDGNIVHQGLAVYGNKGSTDQHAYVQQLRDGLNNFFATFIEVREGRSERSIQVDGVNTSTDYLQGFLRGTRRALYENGRKSVTISIPEVTPRTMGQLIALFERAVSFYAVLINVNAYHQPGVEAGKAAAADFLELLNQVRGHLTADMKTAEDLSAEIEKDAEAVYHCLVHLASNGEASISQGDTPQQDTFSL